LTAEITLISGMACAAVGFSSHNRMIYCLFIGFVINYNLINPRKRR
jgi:hypothetical protein